jgi:type I restriction enzyme R subunit
MAGGEAPEQRSRRVIDAQLERANWKVQDIAEINLYAGQGVAVREASMGEGRADYLLYVDKRIVGVIEAKPAGTTLSGVHWQSRNYAANLTASQKLNAMKVQDELPFIFEASGTETHFTNLFDPEPRARSIFNFPKPETLARTIRFAERGEIPTWRGRVQDMPALDEKLLLSGALRPAQFEAIVAIERSLREQKHSKSLVQMATGAGKTFTAVSESYRLLKFGGFQRILFLVDRNNLGEQTEGEFQEFTTPDDGRKFGELYSVNMLTRAGLQDSSNVVISTIQRVWAALKGEELPDGDDPGLDDFVPEKALEVTQYNVNMPPEAFDLIIVDEAHRSIYGLWRGVLDYFDAHVIGLTATPTKQALGYFGQNLVSEYTFAQSVMDRVNVDFEVYRIRTEITEIGSTIEAGTFVPAMDRKTRAQRLQLLDEDVEYSATELDRSVVSKNQIRTVLETFRDRLYTEIFPGRSEVPKTLIFAKDDNHAEEIVKQAREVFGKGNDFAAKITYNAKNPKQRIKDFRTSVSLRIAVTVDMIATGTDVKAIECVFFMRDVRSRTYFEQMKGRGARTMDDASFQALTPDAKHKEKFIIVDAVGVTEHDFIDAAPLNRTTEKSVSLDVLLKRAAANEMTEDDVATLASRLARLGRELSPAEDAELTELAGMSLTAICQLLITIVDTDVVAAVRENAPIDNTGVKDIAGAMHEFIGELVKPLAANPTLRQRILDLRHARDLLIDETSADTLIDAHGVVDDSKARHLIESWAAYLEENRDEITAIQLLYSKPQGVNVTFKELQELASRIQRPHPTWTPARLWEAYSAIEPGKVRKSASHTTADLVSLVRFTLGVESELVPFADVVEERYQAWLLTQQQNGVTFTDAQRWWLDRIKDYICQGASFEQEALEAAPFTENGGTDGILREFPNAGEIIMQLNQELSA